MVGSNKAVTVAVVVVIAARWCIEAAAELAVVVLVAEVADGTARRCVLGRRRPSGVVCARAFKPPCAALRSLSDRWVSIFRNSSRRHV